jgi:hypothetical protein
VRAIVTMTMTMTWQVASAAARQTALRLEDELRDIAASVAKRTVAGAERAAAEHGARRGSALQALLRADRRRNAAQALQ